MSVAHIKILAEGNRATARVAPTQARRPVQGGKDVGWVGATLAVALFSNKRITAMRVGVGLPSTIPGTDGQLMIERAQRADEGPFSSLGVLDRLVYGSYEPLIAMSTAASVTRRVRLASTIVIGLLRNTG